MFMSYISILVFSLAKVLGEPSPTQSKLTSTSEPTERPDDNRPPILYGSSTEPCRGDDCRSPPSLVAPIVGSLCGILVFALITVFIIWFYLKRKTQKSKEVPMTPAIKFIEQPPLYTGAISTTDSRSKLYGMSPSRNDSMTSHYYDKIDYNERP